MLAPVNAWNAIVPSWQDRLLSQRPADFKRHPATRTSKLGERRLSSTPVRFERCRYTRGQWTGAFSAERKLGGDIGSFRIAPKPDTGFPTSPRTSPRGIGPNCVGKSYDAMRSD